MVKFKNLKNQVLNLEDFWGHIGELWMTKAIELQMVVFREAIFESI